MKKTINHILYNFRRNDKIDDICRKEISDLRVKIAKIETRVEENKALLESIYVKLFGNGNEGILTTLTKHKTYFYLLGTAITLMTGCLIKMLF